MRSDRRRTVLTYMGWTCTVLYCAVQCPPHNITPWLTPTPGHQLWTVIENRWGEITREHQDHGVMDRQPVLSSDMLCSSDLPSVCSVLSVLCLRLGYVTKIRLKWEWVSDAGDELSSSTKTDTDRAGVETGDSDQDCNNLDKLYWSVNILDSDDMRNNKQKQSNKNNL